MDCHRLSGVARARWSMSQPVKTRRIVLAACAAVLAAALVAAWRLASSPAPAMPTRDAPRGERGALVVSADAGVERAASGGPWDVARAGDMLRATDSIRTSARAKAEIALGPRARITLAERSEVTVREIDDAVQRLGLLRGRIGVEQTTEGPRVLRVEDASGTVAATARGGRWGAVASPGRLAVAAEEGAVRLESAGASVQVAAGMQAAAWRGLAPLPPAPVPRQVLLKVARVLESRRTHACAEVRVDVASEVEVNGAPVEVPKDGLVAVRAEDRRRGAEVVVRHASGRVERRRVACVEEADVTDLEVRWNAR